MQVLTCSFSTFTPIKVMLLGDTSMVCREVSRSTAHDVHMFTPLAVLSRASSRQHCGSVDTGVTDSTAGMRLRGTVLLHAGPPYCSVLKGEHCLLCRPHCPRTRCAGSSHPACSAAPGPALPLPSQSAGGDWLCSLIPHLACPGGEPQPSRSPMLKPRCR